MTKLNKKTRLAIERSIELKQINRVRRPWKKPNSRTILWYRASKMCNVKPWVRAWGVWDEEC